MFDSYDGNHDRHLTPAELGRMIGDLVPGLGKADKHRLYFEVGVAGSCLSDTLTHVLQGVAWWARLPHSVTSRNGNVRVYGHSIYVHRQSRVCVCGSQAC